MPETVSIKAFLFAIAFVSLFGSLTKEYFKIAESESGKGSLLKKTIKFHIVLGICFSGYMLSLLEPVRHGGDRMLGWIFAWFCVHGLPAFFVAKLSYESKKLLKMRKKKAS